MNDGGRGAAVAAPASSEAQDARRLRVWWEHYWTAHPHLARWHADTRTRWTRSRRLPPAGTPDGSDVGADVAPFVDAKFLPLTALVKNDDDSPDGQLVLQGAIRDGSHDDDAATTKTRSSNPEIEMLVAAIAGRTPTVVAAASCDVQVIDEINLDDDDGDDDAPNVVEKKGIRRVVLRLQCLGGPSATVAAFETLAPYVAVSISEGQIELLPDTLQLSGDIVTRLGLSEGGGKTATSLVSSVFEVFGKATVSVVSAGEEEDASVAHIRYTADTPALAAANAQAALRTLQLWLAADWGAVLTYYPR